jgi:hypothetical protein
VPTAISDWLMWKPAQAHQQILPLHAGQQKHETGDAKDDQRGSQVWFLYDQQDEKHRHDCRFQQRMLPVAHRVQARVQKPGKK